jgi:hypothetical protein
VPRLLLACGFAASAAVRPGLLSQGEGDGGFDEVECLALFAGGVCEDGDDGGGAGEAEVVAGKSAEMV